MVDYEKMPRRNIIVIDMKSFYATCECVERNLDPYTTPLVVAEPNRNGAITLAVTPYMKSLGVASRTRIYEIDPKIKYMTVPPRMKLYVEYSKKVISIFEKFVSKKDMHIYSIDECFLDVTDYLKMYKLDDYTLARKIMKTIKDELGLISTAGIGPNMLIAKIAMDIEAKHNKDNIAKWTYEMIKEKFWPITPLSEFWGIGRRMEKNLNNLGIKTIGDLANYDKKKLKNKFGIIGEELWNHSNGIDLARIGDFNEKPKDKSFGHSQVLFKDYTDENIPIIIKEMVEVLTARLRRHKKKCQTIGFGIGYSAIYGGGFYHSRRLSAPTWDEETIYEMCITLFQKFYEDFPIRKVSINLSSLIDNNIEQLNLFETFEENVKKDELNKAVDEIKSRYGKNSIIKASNLLKDSTMIERNKKIGGHRE
ncbi:MAG TPA: damage repair protein [Firmicutes bacterium]|nr:damage repair protein [Bacillota bacterium]